MISTIRLPQGIDSGVAWPIEDAGSPADLTGYSAKCQVRKRDSVNSALLAELTARAFDSAVAVTWTAEESLAWSWSEGYSDVILLDPEGRRVQVVWQGKFIVDPVVTGAEVQE